MAKTATTQRRTAKRNISHVFDEDGNLYELTHEEEVAPAPKKQAVARAGSKKPQSRGVKKNTKGTKSAKGAKAKTAKPAAKAPKTVKVQDPSKKKVSFDKKVPRQEELLDDEEVTRQYEKERYKKYKECKRFVKEYEAELAAIEKEQRPEWKKADDLMTKAASIRVRYQGLLNADLGKQQHLPKAIEPLRKKGVKMLEECLAIVDKLSPEEQELFWSSQERNRGVQSNGFDQLVTKKEFDEAQRLVSTAVIQGLVMPDDDDEEVPQAEPAVEAQPVEQAQEPMQVEEAQPAEAQQ
jgi:hypothetical protein